MRKSHWLAFWVLLASQCIFSTQGGSAESSRPGSSAQAQNEEARVAVVIGNSRYTQGALPNPRNDATAMAAALKKLGFDVDLKIDASKADLNDIFKRFSRKAEKAGVAALFYAGHGIQVNGSNYIVPIDANPLSERDLKRELVKMEDIIDDMGDAKVKLIFFDACRDNPLSRSFSRGASRGMAAPVEATGTLISFATKHGNTARDGEDQHSPYTKALLAAMENPAGVEIEQMLRKVQQGVKQATQGQQEPWRYGSLDGDFYFRAADTSHLAKAQQEHLDKAVAAAISRSNEQAEREKAEFQQSIKTQQEATDRAANEMLKRANEQAARERAELEKSITAQKESTDRAVAEAIKRSTEQAARERAEMQQSMEKMLKDALAKQTAQLAAERAARDAAEGKPVKASASDKRTEAAALQEKPREVAPLNASPAMAAAEQGNSVQLASIKPLATNGTAAHTSPDAPLLGSTLSPHEEWEYLAKDIRFGKTKRFVERIKAVVAGSGVLEEFLLEGKTSGEWVFDGKPSLIGVPSVVGLMFSAHWSGKEITDLGISWPNCNQMRCQATAELDATERITVPAGQFETTKINIHLNASPHTGRSSGYMAISVWYSGEHKRVIRQTLRSSGFFGNWGDQETIELAAIRHAPAKH